MRKLGPLFDLRTPLEHNDAVTIEYEGRALQARVGEPLSAALFRAGVLATSRSPKYRRHRGPYCLRGDCGSCHVRISGEPNHRACTTLARDGLRIEAQNKWGPAGIDPSGLIDSIFRGGIDHHHFMVRPRIANNLMQQIARTMTGFGELPEHTTEAPATGAQYSPEVLVIGAGPAGRAAACVIEEAGVEVLTIDRCDRTTLELDDGPLPRELLCEIGIFATYPREGLWAAAAPSLGGRFDLPIVRPRQVILATGAHDPTLPIANNDLPGVVSARGLVRLLRRCDMELRAQAVVIGEGDDAEALAQELAAPLFAVNRVRRITGTHAVTGIELHDQQLPCRIVALAPTPAPNHELAAQAGAPLRFDGHGFAVITEAGGAIPIHAATDSNSPAIPRPWSLWACGDIRGFRGPKAAKTDGQRTAEALLMALANAKGVRR